MVAGFPGFPATMSDADRSHLRSFLQRLRGAPTKVLITSRSEEEWLGPEQRRKVSIGGLQGEEQWAYCEAILGDLGIAIDRKDNELVELMNQLGGHPLAMRVILPRLEKQRAGDVSKAIRSNWEALHGGKDEPLRKLYATLRFVEEGLPEALKPLLVPLGLHERYIDGDYLEAMAQEVDASWTRDRIDHFLGALAHAGLLQDHAQAVYEMHPALSGFLRSGSGSSTPGAARDEWCRAFVNEMGRLANHLTPRELHEQRAGFHWHAANFYHALTEAERLGMDNHHAALVQGLAAYALNMRSFSESRKLFERLAGTHEVAGNKMGEASAYHQLGMIAEEQRDLAAAEAWYGKSLAITEVQGNDLRAAFTYHQLGVVAQRRRDFAAAKTWYRKSLAITEKQDNNHRAAITYHQLGMVAQEQRDFPAAEAWCHKSLAIFEKQGNDHDAAITYHQLGMIAEEQRDFAAAETWYRKSLAINEKQGNDHGAASTYHQLGMVAQQQGDFTAAEAWYRKSLAICERQSNGHGAASTYGQLGILAGLREHFEDSGQWLVKCILAFMRSHDLEGAEKNKRNFVICYTRASAVDQLKLKALWEAAGLGEFPIPDEPHK